MGLVGLVGNDVVDLADAAIHDHHLRVGFIDRVLAPSEHGMLDRATDRKVFLWSLFAAKEAAFKVTQKLRGATVFAHRRFVVAADLRSVRYDDLLLPLALKQESGFVHAVVGVNCPHARSAVEQISAAADQSRAVRSLCRRLTSGVLGCVPSELEIVRESTPWTYSGHGPPLLRLRGKDVGVDISLSHDGRFVAVVAGFPPSMQLLQGTRTNCVGFRANCVGSHGNTVIAGKSSLARQLLA